jgi:UDP-N-acetylmuramoylalanine--D-glutamate ligase
VRFPVISLSFYQNRRVGVLGLGKTGTSVVEAMIASGAEVEVHDDCDSTIETCRQLRKMTVDSIKRLDIMIVSPGISLLWPVAHPMVIAAKKHAIPILSDVDLFQQHIQNGKGIYITGTNGKSTTTALIHYLLAAAGKKVTAGGNFKQTILSLDPLADFFVIEISSYQLESSGILGFDTAILLNVTPDHLTRHGGIEGYLTNKQKIFANFTNRSIAIVGVDDENCASIARFLQKIKHPCLVQISGRNVPAFGVGWNNNLLVDNRRGESEVVCNGSMLQLDGDHNRQNIAAAYAACADILEKETFCQGLSSFTGLNHRQEVITCIDGIIYVNDSKATNSDSAEQALKRFDNIVWILGGRPKEKGLEDLVKYFGKVKFAFLIGEGAEDFAQTLGKYGVRHEITGTLDVAVRRSKEIARVYDAKVVLLSPVCASFDQFKDFEDRGDQFRALVRDLK